LRTLYGSAQPVLALTRRTIPPARRGRQSGKCLGGGSASWHCSTPQSVSHTVCCWGCS